MRFPGILAVLTAMIPAHIARAGEPLPSPFAQRGYYFTFTRMPTYGLDAWKQIIDCVRDDGGNTVILWMGGGFRSKKFPETWQYNRDHANIKKDFVKYLIDYSHAAKIKILLGFTPFGYDGTNQMSLTRPEWKATGPDGKPTAKFGFHSWGYNLCPSRTDTQRFMLEYVREMDHDFYPNADGLLVESSDYAACHCKDCGAKFYDREFQFVKALSDEVWAKDKAARVVVFPHYFTGSKVPGLGVTAAKQPFDNRWSLIFSPHSAHPDAGLIRKAPDSIWWDEAVARQTPSAIREGVRKARREKCSSYIPSLEVFTYVTAEPEEGQQYLVGRRQVPYGFGWLKDGQIPYNELPVRVNRIAYREYTRNPDLPDDEFRKILGKDLFGDAAAPEAIADALELQKVFAHERTWTQPAPLMSPLRVKVMNDSNQLTEQKRAVYRSALNRVREIESRYRDKGEAFVELHRVAKWVTDLWAGPNGSLLGRSQDDQ